MQYAIPYLAIEKAATHTHHKNGYQAPSAEDIYQLIKKRKENKDFAGSFIVAFNGEKYALSITDWEKARNFLNTEGAFLNGEKWKEDSEIGKAFVKAKKYFEIKFKNNLNKTNLSYEMAMAAVLSQYNAGVTLNKKDANGNFNPIVVKSAPDPKKPKKTIYIQDCL